MAKVREEAKAPDIRVQEPPKAQKFVILEESHESSRKSLVSVIDLSHREEGLYHDDESESLNNVSESQRKLLANDRDSNIAAEAPDDPEEFNSFALLKTQIQNNKLKQKAAASHERNPNIRNPGTTEGNTQLTKNVQIK